MSQDQACPEILTCPQTEVEFFPWPVYAYFGTQQFHSYRIDGDFDLQDICEKYENAVMRSEANGQSQDRADALRRVLLRFRDNVWCLAEERRLTVYASDQGLAEEVADVLRIQHTRKRPECCFYVLRQIYGGELYAQPVRLSGVGALSNSDLALHYGTHFPAWMQSWLKRFHTAPFGLTLFRGEPGTGKTTFIRHLIRTTTQSHRFYFVPPSVASQLSNPAMINFWLDENKDSRGLRYVAIFEDAEPLLEPRHDGNQALVSDLLNAADGLLGDCLHLHLLATVNAPLERLDKAVTRPGRLIGYREFCRLTPGEASALAKQKGVELPAKESFSLAEIYNQAAAPDVNNKAKPIGFAPAAS